MTAFRQVDVFGSGPLSGNPLAVVHDADSWSTDQMARFANWTNLSETTFLLPPLDAAAVRAFATGKLAHYKIPRYVQIVEEFPMTVTGKVRKIEMREKTIAALHLGMGHGAGDTPV